MPPAELFRIGLAVVFSLAAAYSVARFSMSAARKPRWHDVPMPGERASSATHALTGCCLAILVLPGGPPGVPAFWWLGAAAFLVVASRFATALRKHGVMSRAGAEGSAHGGYNLHHLMGSVAMIYLCVTASLFTTTSSTPAAPLETMHLTSVNWLLGLYFLVAATSLGFRVTEPPVRVTYRVLAPAGAPGIATFRATAQRNAPAQVLTAPIGMCATEVILSAGLALLLLGIA